MVVAEVSEVPLRRDRRCDSPFAHPAVQRHDTREGLRAEDGVQAPDPAARKIGARVLLRDIPRGDPHQGGSEAMNAAQTNLYFFEWGQVRKHFLAKGIDSKQADKKRHELHRRALGADKSSKD